MGFLNRKVIGSLLQAAHASVETRSPMPAIFAPNPAAPKETKTEKKIRQCTKKLDKQIQRLTKRAGKLQKKAEKLGDAKSVIAQRVEPTASAPVVLEAEPEVQAPDFYQHACESATPQVQTMAEAAQQALAAGEIIEGLVRTETLHVVGESGSNTTVHRTHHFEDGSSLTSGPADSPVVIAAEAVVAANPALATNAVADALLNAKRGNAKREARANAKRERSDREDDRKH